MRKSKLNYTCELVNFKLQRLDHLNYVRECCMQCHAIKRTFQLNITKVDGSHEREVLCCELVSWLSTYFGNLGYTTIELLTPY